MDRTMMVGLVLYGLGAFLVGCAAVTAYFTQNGADFAFGIPGLALTLVGVAVATGGKR